MIQSPVNHILSPSRGRKTASERDYPSANSGDINTFKINWDKQTDFMLRYKIQFASFRDLTSLYRAWIRDNRGLSAYALLQASKTSGITYDACYQRLRLLIKKGFVMVLGCSNGASLYAPTDKAIKELSELCEGV